MTPSHCQVLPVFSGDDPKSFLIKEAWLPFAVFGGLDVEVEVSQKLSFLELFSIECLLTLGECRAEDLFNVSGMTEELAAHVLESLVRNGLADKTAMGMYIPLQPKCSVIYEEGCRVETRIRNAGVVWFPETEHVIVEENTRCLSGFMQAMANMRSCGRMPIKKQDVGRCVAVNQAIRRGRCLSELAVVGVRNDSSDLPKEVPSYFCSLDAQKSVITLIGEVGWRSRAKSNGNVSPSLDGDANVEMRHSLLDRYAPVLKEQAKKSLISCHPEIHRFIKTYGDGEIQQVDSGFKVLVDEGMAKRLAEDFVLSAEPLGLEITTEKIVLEVPLFFEPLESDPGAVAIFSRMQVLAQCCRPDITYDLAVELCTQHSVSLADVLDQLWAAKNYHAVYKIRAKRDFSFDEYD